MGVQFLIKPASSACNMNCEYCFYNDLASHRTVSDTGRMSLATLENIVRRGLDQNSDYCGFAFQGGEPTLVGLDFYRQLISLQQRYNVHRIPIFNSIQTNGYRLDQEWAKFLAKNRFLVGISLDGSAMVHDRYRFNRVGQPTFEPILQSIDLLKKYKVEYNVLSVVTDYSVDHLAASYRFFKEQGFSYLQYIPCLEPLPSASKTVAKPTYLSVDGYQRFLIQIFDLWFQDLMNGNYISIRHLDNWLGILLGRPPEACNMQGRCSIQYVIEANGDVYPCDFYALDEWKIGNINSHGIDQIRRHPRAKEFIQNSFFLPPDCQACRYLALCRNGCKRDRLPTSGKLYYCSAIQNFFTQREAAMEVAIAKIQSLRAGS